MMVDVAVKKLDKLLQDSDKEFQTEMSVIGQTHHINLVRLLGYCNEGQHWILVYELMSNGTLASFLFTSLKPNWNQRFQIVLGIARGLVYLHEGCCTQIIHCDIKPQNILLDDHYNARISYFGLAKLLLINQSHTETRIRGTKGYVAPDWFRSAPITVKVDTYSFGVLLLEIICCRKNVEKEFVNEEQGILTDWAYDCYKTKRLDNLLENDNEVGNDMMSLEKLVMIVIWCIQEDPSLRPTMKEVLLMLEGIVEVVVPRSPYLYGSVSINSDTYSDTINSKKTQKDIRVMEILEKHGQADVFAYEVLLNGYCKADIVDAANKVLDRMKKRGFLPDVVTYNILFGSLCGRGKLDLALRVMDHLLKDNCRPNVSSAWLLYKSSTAGNRFLSATLQGFSVFDDREGVEQGFRLAIGKPESIGASPPSTLSYYENQESIDSSSSKGNNFEPVHTMLIVDMKFGPDSTFVSVCIQRPQLLVALDFLLAVVEFFVPTVSSMLSFEEHNSSMMDAIIIDQSIYKQPCAEFSLSPQKPLIVDDENFDHFIYDGDGGILYLKDGRGLNLTSASSEAIIYIGNGKNCNLEMLLLRFQCLTLSILFSDYSMNLRFRCMPKLISLVICLQGGQHLDSCVFLGANSSYLALNDDHVYLEQSVESPQAISPRGSVHEVPSQNNAANSSAEVIVELQ
ncbi:hypothetical protein RYX36_030812, partial [Vicia faba]